MVSRSMTQHDVTRLNMIYTHVMMRAMAQVFAELHIARSASTGKGPNSAPASTTKGSRALDAHPKRQSSLRRTHRAR